jgi:glucose/mannose-6-phosphate isomerase
MNNLDDSALFNSLDKSGMRLQIQGLPAQCRNAWEKASSLKLPEDYKKVNKVLILGMGGSAIGGDLLRASTFSSNSPLIMVHRDYDLPSYVDENTLVVASSYSGNTEETLSGFTQALDCKCKKLVISTGGKLTSLAREAGVPIFVIEHVSPPRAALGYSLLPLLAIMQNLGIISDKSAEVDSMVRSLETLCESWQEDTSIEHNQAKKLALKLDGKLIVIYGSGILADVARRWKTQINENSKSWAFFEVLPELNHNAVIGYRYPPSLREQLFVLMLRCPSLHPRTLIRYKITGELLEQQKIQYQILDSDGINPLKHIMSLVFLGDWVSYYLAILIGVDPTPVPEIDFLKKRLSKAK